MTGGFAVLAYPAEYRNSGIMTFIVGKDGVVYQKDLGEKTTDLAAAMAEYNLATAGTWQLERKSLTPRPQIRGRIAHAAGNPPGIGNCGASGCLSQ